MIADIVLIHGVLMNPVEMLYLKNQLDKANFTVHSLYYPTVNHDIAENTEHLHRKIKALKLPAVHVVAHSLGGVMTMHLLDHDPELVKGRVVLLGTPLNGSYLAKELAGWPVAKQLLENSMDNGLDGDFPIPTKQYDIGMIAGKKSTIGLGLLVGGMPEESDGTVLISETKHPMLKEHIVIDTTHTGLVFSKEAAKLTVNFLNNGSFKF